MFQALHGQSAIEYLMTYGWMLLVVAVVGAAVFSLAGERCTESSSGFEGSDIMVQDFGVTDSGRLQVATRNAGSDTVNIKKIRFNDEDYTVNIGEEISVGSSSSFSVEGAVESGCNSNDVTITYDTGGLKNMQVSGSLTGQFNVIDIFRQSPVCSEENYPQKFEGTGNETDPYEISNIYDLQCMQSNLTADYELINDIDASNTEEWNRNESKGVYQGFKPIGGGTYNFLSVNNGCDTGDRFCGSLEGNGHQITNLHLNWSDKYYVGLIGYAHVEDQHNGVDVKNLDIAQSHVRGGRFTGTLIGRTAYDGSNIEGAEFENIRVSSGEVKTDGNEIGGLIGTSGFLQEGLRLDNSSFSGTVEGQNRTGGLIGRMRHFEDIINMSFSNGSVTGTNKVGGLVGEIDGANEYPIRQSYSTMDVSGNNQVGGLLGYSKPAEPTLVVNQSFFAGNLNGGSKSGALYGELKYKGLSGDDEYLNVYWDEDKSGITNPDNCYGVKDSANIVVNCDSGNFNLGTDAMQGLNADQNMVKLEFESEGGPWRVQEGYYPALAWELE